MQKTKKSQHKRKKDKAGSLSLRTQSSTGERTNRSMKQKSQKHTEVNIIDFDKKAKAK
jgi:hypothetical protein